MKKTLTLTALGLAAALMLTGCSSGGASLKQPAADSADKLVSTLSFQDTMSPINESMISTLYGIAASDVKAEKVYVSTGATAEEVAVFEAKDTAGAAKVKAAVETRVDDLKSNFTNYVPAELQKLQNPVIVQKGNVVVFCTSNDSAAAQKAADELFQ